ncbi:hypothetical protein D3C73_1282990 [compost metagenome]
MPLWVSLLEVEFNILIVENEPLTKDFIREVNINKKTEIDKWLELIRYYFKMQYFKRQDRELNALNLGETTFHRYEV